MPELRAMQLDIVQMISRVDSIFQKNNIPYVLLGGSVLGAIRHRGFIPWDDDMDIGVFRADFDRAERLLSEMHEYVYESAEKHIVPDAPIGHLHLVNGQYKIENSPTLDVFALDKVPHDEKQRKRLRRIANVHHLSVLRKAPQNRGVVKKAMVSLLLWFVPNGVWEYIRKKTLHSIVRLNDGDFSCIGNIFGAWTEKEYFNASVYTNTMLADFENLHLPIPQEYDLYLTQLYGNYQELPPLEKRKPRHKEFFAQ